MATIKNPILFSGYFGIDASALSADGLIDPFLNVDVPLFIDPILLEKSSNKIIRGEAYSSFCEHFANLVRLLSISERSGDPAWKAAARLLNLKEPPENGLGYGGSGRSGSSRPEEIKAAILATTKDIVRLGSKDPEMISLMGFFEERVGPDTISDFTTRVVSRQLAKITESFCKKNGIVVSRQSEDQEFLLPCFQDSKGRSKPILLVPRDIVRELPTANDWSEVEAAADANERVRQRVNGFLAGLVRPTVSERKDAIRRASTESKELFEAFLHSVKDQASHYNPNEDSLGYFRIKAILSEDKDAFRVKKQYSLNGGIQSVVGLVRDTIEMFKHHVENGNLWEELWLGDSPKRERAAQLIYYAMADCYCIANGVDISPEANMGGGPINFKFSRGYHARVLVEMKRSQGTVKHGYERQLKIYKRAAKTFEGFFVVLDYGDLGEKLNQIEKIRAERLSRGEPASEIIVIDASKKISASKRN